MKNKVLKLVLESCRKTFDHKFVSLENFKNKISVKNKSQKSWDLFDLIEQSLGLEAKP